MPVEHFQRIACDRCGETRDVAGDKRFTVLDGWVGLQASNLHSTGLSGADLSVHTILCSQCRVGFANWLQSEKESRIAKDPR